MINFNAAIVRRPALTVCDGLRASDGDDPDYVGVVVEHDAYINALRAAGVNVIILDALDEFPDSVFVEDPALVFPDFAIVLRPGAPSRRGEAAAIVPTLRDNFRGIFEIKTGFVDGGDILQAPHGVMIGLSARTDKEGADALQKTLHARGLASEIVSTPDDVLHFKSDCALLDGETVLSTPRLAASGVFQQYEILPTPEGEEGAANALRVNDVVFLGAEYPRTIDIVEDAGFNVVALATKEIAKIDAGLSCMSLRWMKP